MAKRKKKQDTSGDSTPESTPAKKIETVRVGSHEDYVRDMGEQSNTGVDDAAERLMQQGASERSTNLEGYTDDDGAGVLEGLRRIADEGFNADLRGLGESDEEAPEEGDEFPPEPEQSEEVDDEGEDSDEIDLSEYEHVHDFSPEEMELPVRMKIDGEEKFVKLEDVLSGYNSNAAATTRFMEAAEIRKEAQSQQEEALALRQQGQQLLTAFGQFYSNRLNPQEKAAFTESLRSAIVDTETTAQVLQAARVQEEMPKLIEAIPEWDSPEAREQGAEELVRGAEKHYGIPEDVTRSLVDHRHVLALRDAIRYREGMAGAEDSLRKAGRKTGNVLKPGAKKHKGTARTRQRKRYQKAAEKAKRTGSIDDAAERLLATGLLGKGGN